MNGQTAAVHPICRSSTTFRMVSMSTLMAETCATSVDRRGAWSAGMFRQEGVGIIRIIVCGWRVATRCVGIFFRPVIQAFDNKRLTFDLTPLRRIIGKMREGVDTTTAHLDKGDYPR